MPCPFCGGTAELCCHDATGVAWVRCMSCGVTSNGGRASQAVEEWNTRTERTCQQVDVTGRFKPYVTHMTACSLCGETLAVDEYHAPNFCPNCGAKVTKGKEARDD